ncbi:MAG: hypothetical protein WD038_08910 [Balneolales bacterium]
MEVSSLLIMGIFVAVLVLAGVAYTISEFNQMNVSGDQKNNDDDEEY